MDFYSRKFLLAVAAMLATIAGLFTDRIDGNDWFLAIGVILGLYGAANVAQHKVSK